MHKTINISNVAYPINFGYAALMDFTDQKGITLSGLATLSDSLAVSDIVLLAHVGLKHGARVAKTEFNLDLFDVADLFDTDSSLMERIMKEFSDSMVGITEVSGKKKAILTGKIAGEK